LARVCHLPAGSQRTGFHAADALQLIPVLFDGSPHAPEYPPRANPLLSIDTSIIHDTLAVIANEVKQSSESKMHFLNHLDCHVGFASAALRSQLTSCCNDEVFWIP
jgi:hypothetical protein